MAIFNRYESCRGFTIFKFKKFRIEIWYCPAKYEIIEHRHPEEDIELIFIFGQTVFSRRDINSGVIESLATSWKMFGRKFSVKHYHSHWFKVGRLPLIFINVQRFFNDYDVKSAAQDFLVENRKD